MVLLVPVSSLLPTLKAARNLHHVKTLFRRCTGLSPQIAFGPDWLSGMNKRNTKLGGKRILCTSTTDRSPDHRVGNQIRISKAWDNLSVYLFIYWSLVSTTCTLINSIKILKLRTQTFLVIPIIEAKKIFIPFRVPFSISVWILSLNIS